MISLAIDTSAHLCAAAIHDDVSGRVLAQRSEDIGRGHAERLMEVVGEVLREAHTDYSGIERVSVTVGPGSFTGIRVGLATARGVALALGVAAVGVSVLEAAGEHCAELGLWDRVSPLLVAMDARRGEAYGQFLGAQIASAHPQGPFVAGYDRLAGEAAGFPGLALCGSGAQSTLEAMAREAQSPELPVLHRLAAIPIETIARMGAARPASGERPEPLYLRAPDAKPQLGFAVRRA